MEEEYVFPKDNWYIKVTEDNKEILEKWRLDLNYTRSLDVNEYVNWQGRDRGGSDSG